MLPVFYSAATLTLFMRDVLAETGKALNWDDTRFVEPMRATLLAYGVTTVEAATNIGKLRLLASIEAWRAVMNATAGDFDAGSQGDELKRSQVHAQATKMFNLARTTYSDWIVEQRPPEGGRFASSSRTVEASW